MRPAASIGKPHRWRKPTKAERIRFLEYLERPDCVKAESERIRRAAGLEPLPPSKFEAEARAILAQSPPSRRKRKDEAPTDPLEAARRLRDRRRANAREAERLEAELAALAAEVKRSSGSSMSAAARILGLSRQRLYQLAA